MKFRNLLTLSVLLAMCVAFVQAQEEEANDAKPDDAAEFDIADSGKDVNLKVEVVLEGLYNPCGVAVRPGAAAGEEEIFVADSGNLRIVKMKANEPGKAIDVITEFPKSTYGKGPIYDIGPLGLTFLTPNMLVVGGGGFEDGKEIMRVYKLPEGDEAIKADAMDHSVGPIEPGDVSKQGEGNFYALAKTDDAVYIASNGDDTKGWLLKAPVKANKLTGLTGFIATKEKTEVDAPVGIAISPRGYIVVGQMGEITIPNDSLLTFYNPKDGEMALNLETQLFDIAGLAYSNTSRLYAVDFAWMDAAEGGLFRLEATENEDGTQGVEANKFVALDKPTAIAVGMDNALYVTVFGSAPEGSDEKATGKLLKITADADKL